MSRLFNTLLALVLLSAVFIVKSEGDVDEKDVVVLGADNFDETISKNEFVFVEFYAPWCGHCKHLVPEYAKTATTLKNEGSSVVIAKVDATVHGDLASKYGVRGYPTLKFFRNGSPIDYESGRTAEDIIRWIKKKTGPASKLLTTSEEVSQFIGQEGTKAIAYLSTADEENADTKEWIAAAKSGKLEDFLLAHVVDASLLGDNKAPTVVIYKTGETPVTLTDSFAKDNILKFAAAEGYPLVSELAQPIWQRCSTAQTPLVAVFITEKTDEALETIRSIALKFKGTVAFSYSTTASLADRWGASGKVFPTAILVKWVDGAPKFTIFDEEAETFTAATGESFVTKAMAGEYSSYKKSEPLPESNDGPVKIVVGKNYDSIVNDKTKDVFVEFYAPWCGHCKQLAPVWEELGEEFEDVETVVIAKMDGTANSAPDNVEIQGFPTLTFFPADNKAGIPYNGNRDLASLKQFVLDNASTKVSEKKDEL